VAHSCAFIKKADVAAVSAERHDQSDEKTGAVTTSFPFGLHAFWPPSKVLLSELKQGASKVLLSELVQSSPVQAFNSLRPEPLPVNKVTYPASADGIKARC
jgi:hypothetical protein